MTEQSAVTRTETGKVPAPIVLFRRELIARKPQFAAALPAHIPAERFIRIVVSAAQRNEKLLRCSWPSLFNAAMRAAQDGLLPDGREGAIVPFRDEDDDGRKGPDTASWMPMIYGIRKKARNSGELIDLYAHVVHEGDEYDYQLGDSPFIKHKPSRRGGRTRPVIAAYSVAVLKGGYKTFEVMNIDEIEDVRKRYSRAKKGPWSDPVAFPEMCRKTVQRLHAKSLPMSTDLDKLIHRDDELYNFAAARERGEQMIPPANMQAAFDQFAGGAADDGEMPGEVIEHDDPPASGTAPTSSAAEATTAKPREAKDEAAPEQAEFDRLLELAKRNPPGTPEVMALLARQLIAAARAHPGGKNAGADALNAWWHSPAARDMRNKAGMTSEDTTPIAAELKAACEELRK